MTELLAALLGLFTGGVLNVLIDRLPLRAMASERGGLSLPSPDAPHAGHPVPPEPAQAQPAGGRHPYPGPARAETAGGHHPHPDRSPDAVGTERRDLYTVPSAHNPPDSHAPAPSPLDGQEATARPLAWWEWLPLASLYSAAREQRSPFAWRARYPAVELLTAGLFGLAWLRFDGEPFTLAAVMLFTAALIALAFMDLETTYLPDLLVLPALAVALVLSPFWPEREWWQGFAGAALGYGVFYPLAWIGDRLDRDVMGWGDVKLAAALGAMLGVPLLLLGLYLGVLAGGLVGIAVYVARLVGVRRALIPYGPFLVMGGLASLYYGRALLDWFAGQL